MADDLTLKLDLDRISSVVKGRVRPVVEDLLSNIDLDALIRQRLLEVNKDAHSSGMFPWSMTLPEPSLDQMVRSEITEVAKEFVQRSVRAHREEIEDALWKMMRSSKDKIVQAFGESLKRAFDEDWSFELDVKVNHVPAGAN